MTCPKLSLITLKRSRSSRRIASSNRLAGGHLDSVVSDDVKALARSRYCQSDAILDCSSIEADPKGEWSCWTHSHKRAS